MYSWYSPHVSWYHSDVPNVLNTHDVLNTHHTGWLYCSQSNFHEQQEGEHPGKNATLDWLSTHCGLSQSLSLPCDIKFSIIHLSTNNLQLCQVNCGPQCSVLKVNACCLMLAISYFVLLSQPLFVLCLFEKVY